GAPTWAGSRLSAGAGVKRHARLRGRARHRLSGEAVRARGGGGFGLFKARVSAEDDAMGWTKELNEGDWYLLHTLVHVARADDEVVPMEVAFIDTVMKALDVGDADRRAVK